MAKHPVITGLGLLCASGRNKDEFWDNLIAGRPGYRPVTLFETDRFHVNVAAEVPDFNAKEFMGQKGLRTLDRATKLLVSASKMAVADAGLEITEENTDDLGVSCGTTFGSLKSIADFDMVTLTDGPRYTNPAHFPNTVINSPSSQVSIWNNVQGFNTTISNGFTSSIDALSYSLDTIDLGRARLIWTGGVEELCEQTFFGMHALEFLSGCRRGEAFINCPFDRRRNGVTLGEGACLVAVEGYESARSRGARILAGILGIGHYLDCVKIHTFNRSSAGMVGAMKDTLRECGLTPADIDVIVASANSFPVADDTEARAIKEVFGSHASRIPVTAPKSAFGETYSMGGILGVAVALGVFERGLVPPTLNLESPAADAEGLDIVAGEARPVEARTIMINNFGPGNHTSVVLQKPGEER